MEPIIKNASQNVFSDDISTLTCLLKKHNHDTAKLNQISLKIQTFLSNKDTFKKLKAQLFSYSLLGPLHDVTLLEELNTLKETLCRLLPFATECHTVLSQVMEEPSENQSYKTLPPELFPQIAFFLPFKDLISLLTVSKNDQKLVQNIIAERIDQSLKSVPNAFTHESYKPTSKLQNGSESNLTTTDRLIKTELFRNKNKHLAKVVNSLNLLGNLSIKFITLQIKELNLSGCETLLDRGIENFTQMPLKKINLSKCSKLTDKGIALLENLSTLRVLHLSWCPNLTNQSLQSCQKMNLEEIHVAGCSLMDDQGAKGLINKPLKKFEYLDTKISPETASKIRSS